MINILFNPDCPELIFSVASFVLAIEKEHHSDQCVFMPFKPCELGKDLTIIQKELDNELQKLIGDDYFNGRVNPGQNKYALFGIHPKDEYDAREIANFFDKHAEDIIMWADYHVWPDNLLMFLSSQNEKVIIDHTCSCLEKMKHTSSPPEEWLKAEEAMMYKNINNPLAARYLKNFFVMKNSWQSVNELEKSNGGEEIDEDAALFVLFNSIITELIKQTENLFITHSEVIYDQKFKKPAQVMGSFSDLHPIFAEAKKLGRSVGCLVLDRVEDYFDSQEVIAKGLEKFPWLCILSYRIGQKNFVAFESRYLPIHKMVDEVTVSQLSFAELLKRLSTEVLRFGGQT